MTLLKLLYILCLQQKASQRTVVSKIVLMHIEIFRSRPIKWTPQLNTVTAGWVSSKGLRMVNIKSSTSTAVRLKLNILSLKIIECGFIRPVLWSKKPKNIRISLRLTYVITPTATTRRTLHLSLYQPTRRGLIALVHQSATMSPSVYDPAKITSPSRLWSSGARKEKLWYKGRLMRSDLLYLWKLRER